LTPCGKRLRDHGLNRPTDAPPMFRGGCPLYAERPIWARRQRGGEWRIEEL
jgi:hypothetical protein